VLNEFAPPHTELIVICETPDGKPDTLPLSDLLPRAFGGEMRQE
jgi:cytidine deaminase